MSGTSAAGSLTKLQPRCQLESHWRLFGVSKDWGRSLEEFSFLRAVGLKVSELDGCWSGGALILSWNGMLQYGNSFHQACKPRRKQSLLARKINLCNLISKVTSRRLYLCCRLWVRSKSQVPSSPSRGDGTKI